MGNKLDGKLEPRNGPCGPRCSVTVTVEGGSSVGVGAADSSESVKKTPDVEPPEMSHCRHITVPGMLEYPCLCLPALGPWWRSRASCAHAVYEEPG